MQSHTDQIPYQRCSATHPCCRPVQSCAPPHSTLLVSRQHSSVRLHRNNLHSQGNTHIWALGARRMHSASRGGAAGRLGGDGVPGQEQRADAVDGVLCAGHTTCIRLRLDSACSRQAARAAEHGMARVSVMQDTRSCRAQGMSGRHASHDECHTPSTAAAMQACYRLVSGAQGTLHGRQCMRGARGVLTRWS